MCDLCLVVFFIFLALGLFWGLWLEHDISSLWIGVQLSVNGMRITYSKFLVYTEKTESPFQDANNSLPQMRRLKGLFCSQQ